LSLELTLVNSQTISQTHKRPSLLSCIYLTRHCPMRCRYCRIRDSPLIRGRELTLEEWIKAFDILKTLGVDFNLILGNEILILGYNLVQLLTHLHKTNNSYALYTTFPKKLWEEYKFPLLGIGIKNISCGLDTLPELCTSEKLDDIQIKSYRGFEQLKWAERMGVPDLQGTITLSKLNLNYFPCIAQKLTEHGIWTGVNIIHYAKDDLHDFFPPREEIEDLLLTDKDLPLMREKAEEMKELIRAGQVMVQNVPEFFDAGLEHGIKLDWHCKYLTILSVDADGTMRTCGYRRGNRVSEYTIFDLLSEDYWHNFVRDWRKDMQECPGCFWSYWGLSEWYYERKLGGITDFGVEYFQTHKSEYWRK